MSKQRNNLQKKKKDYFDFKIKNFCAENDITKKVTTQRMGQTIRKSYI